MEQSTVTGLLERLRACSIQARAAAEADDADALRSLLRERGRIMARLDPLLERARVAAADPRTAPAADTRRVRDALAGVQAADRELEEELARGRARARRELDRATHGAAGQAAYRAPRPSSGRHVNLVR